MRVNVGTEDIPQFFLLVAYQQQLLPYEVPARGMGPKVEGVTYHNGVIQIKVGFIVYNEILFGKSKFFGKS